MISHSFQSLEMLTGASKESRYHARPKDWYFYSYLLCTKSTTVTTASIFCADKAAGTKKEFSLATGSLFLSFLQLDLQDDRREFTNVLPATLLIYSENFMVFYKKWRASMLTQSSYNMQNSEGGRFMK